MAFINWARIHPEFRRYNGIIGVATAIRSGPDQKATSNRQHSIQLDRLDLSSIDRYAPS
jgi:hypothetical protein